ncbi:hypothetical protein [Acinetobacter bereziniae]|uniref:hypothetical protein n=1 Tax=Acinetobacter bereziniae TaxID=106648 RepID=UPI0032B5681B
MINVSITDQILQDIETDPNTRIDFILYIKNRLNMPAHEAANFCRVTLRTWQYWESRSREMPMAAAELFLLKLHRICNRIDHPREGLIVVTHEDGVTPLDVISGYNFLSLDDTDDPNYKMISSMAVNIQNRESYIHRTKFRINANTHVINWVNRNIRVQD